MRIRTFAVHAFLSALMLFAAACQPHQPLDSTRTITGTVTIAKNCLTVWSKRDAKVYELLSPLPTKYFVAKGKIHEKYQYRDTSGGDNGKVTSKMVDTEKVVARSGYTASVSGTLHRKAKPTDACKNKVKTGTISVTTIKQ